MATKMIPRQSRLSPVDESCPIPTALLKALKKDLYLYTASTPNAHTVSVFLEELKDVYPNIDYE
jgi:hypothetical protein